MDVVDNVGIASELEAGVVIILSTSLVSLASVSYEDDFVDEVVVDDFLVEVLELVSSDLVVVVLSLLPLVDVVSRSDVVRDASRSVTARTTMYRC